MNKLIVSILIFIIILIIGLIIFLIIKFDGINKVNYNKKSGHLGILKSKNLKKRKGAVIELSTKKKSQGKYNIPMVHNTNPKSNEPSYIIPKVRNRKLSDLKILNDHILNKKDKKTTDNIYKEHLKNKNRLEKAKKITKKIKKRS